MSGTPGFLKTTETVVLTDVGTAHTSSELQSRRHCTVWPSMEARELRASAHRLNHQQLSVQPANKVDHSQCCFLIIESPFPTSRA